MAKGFKGGLKDTPFDFLVYSLLKEVNAKSRLDPSLVEDICMGNVYIPSPPYRPLCYADHWKVANEGCALVTRAAALAAGFPESAGTSSVNRFCSSGLKAVQEISNQILAGSIEVGIAIGAESMTLDGNIYPKMHPEITKHEKAAECDQPMGQTSENVSSDFNISRERQDRFAAESFRKAELAQKSGWFDDEIIPIETEAKDPKTGELKRVTLTKDEGPKWGTTFQALNKIRPAFPKFGITSTGGNSSQVTDGGICIQSALKIIVIADAFV